MSEPTQAIYDAMFSASLQCGFATYDFLPKEEVEYPFVVLQSALLIPRPTKGTWLGGVSLAIDVFGLGSDRKKVSEIAHRLMRCAKALSLSGVHLVPSESMIEMLPDQSTAIDLWHGRVHLSFRF
ncbi:MAG: hypothetical protein SPJ59_02320 [Peptoniphilaceae bacterium]|nr:hypothetical protein [Peptoniphilaceae bacterium]MDD7542761.1 hypothetical protein [Peptoniphilaceae bacterium]MDY3987342.1 hypothetical protein [Peptoniphilaceae bacterium]MDY4196702.1 hypothetical protein [Peptoniphilaceae bacterium]MDY5765962.1 hypothetical protein [Peptoniphilaceae bacterium]